VILVFVIPVFEEMFASMGGTLPAPTQVVVAMSRFVQTRILYIIGFIVLFKMAFSRLLKTEKGREGFDALMLKMPIIGILIRKVAVAKFTRTMGTMLSSGVAILEALDIVAKTAGNKIIEKALLSIPAESDYAKIIRDVIKLHGYYSDNWQAAWTELESKWGNEDICGAGSSFNIDAKLNGAYIAMGLLYGEGDPLKTLEIATRCGQDSDCNPSNAMAVLGVIKGFSGLPSDMQEGVSSAGDSLFVNTSYTFNSAVSSTYKYALELIASNGGKVTDQEITIKTQVPVAPVNEVSYPGLIFDKTVSIFDKSAWKFTGDWKTFQRMSWPDNVLADQSMYSEKAGDELELTFTGTGISLEGNWARDGGKADVYVDGILHRSIDTYYFFANQEHTTSMWHVLNLQPGEHKVRLVVKGEKRPEAEGCRIYITQALLFKTGSKKSDGYKFSFE